MRPFIGILQNSYIDTIKMALFNTFKTGDAAIDSFITALVIALISYIVNYFHQENNKNNNCLKLFKQFLSFVWYKKNVIIIEGKKCSSTCSYDYSCVISSVYSNRFKAIWNHIENTMETNKTINKIKEYHTNYNNSENKDIYMVSQSEYFLIDKDIFAIAEFEKEEDSDKSEKVKTKIDKIRIQIYSYKYSLLELKTYIDDITIKYLHSIKTRRSNKKFIYTLTNIKYDEDELNTKYNCWCETEFESTRTFDNIFFDGKEEIINNINFFVNNKKWFYEKGIPYTLGIGLHGPPGTGKTSFIKALANTLNKHIIIIPFKLIKTKAQLDNFFYESTYNIDNVKNSITFDKKIIVFEDIDCIGDIILDRSKSKPNKKYLKGKRENDSVKIGDVLQSIVEDMNETSFTKTPKQTVSSYSRDEPITLDDILNLWDGIRETPGRILLISSNHYNKLDPALIRPGRIDISHELSNSSHDIISQIYSHLYGKSINENILKKIKPYFYSPAEIVNLYINNKNNENAFLKRLVKNKKLL